MIETGNDHPRGDGHGKHKREENADDGVIDDLLRGWRSTGLRDVGVGRMRAATLA